jgi:hypothetical protein
VLAKFENKKLKCLALGGTDSVNRARGLLRWNCLGNTSKMQKPKSLDLKRRYMMALQHRWPLLVHGDEGSFTLLCVADGKRDSVLVIARK